MARSRVFFGAVTAAGGTPPVAAFSADVTTGTEPLSIVFTDASTNTPTSWLWERDSGSGYSTFSTAQNPSVSWSVGTWDVKLTATNADGSDAEEKLDYITVSAGAGSGGGGVLRSRKLGFITPPGWCPY